MQDSSVLSRVTASAVLFVSDHQAATIYSAVTQQAAFSVQHGLPGKQQSASFWQHAVVAHAAVEQQLDWAVHNPLWQQLPVPS
ncbi:MAG: hypothetical protein DWH91_06095 [Planctomycetota bacterium]|nr:MAG: hypothetical protein DWH91_06095 [Planctomycetota bacterium]